MNVNPISVAISSNQQSQEKKGNDFMGHLGNAISQGLNDVAQSQNKVDELAAKLVLGELDDLHQLTIASEKAKLSLQLAVQVRNKAVEAYQEISRMQI